MSGHELILRGIFFPMSCESVGAKTADERFSLILRWAMGLLMKTDIKGVICKWKSSINDSVIAFVELRADIEFVLGDRMVMMTFSTFSKLKAGHLTDTMNQLWPSSSTEHQWSKDRVHLFVPCCRPVSLSAHCVQKLNVVGTGLCKGVGLTVSSFPLLGQP